MKISIEDDQYPDQLRRIKKPPKQLYLKGNTKLLQTPGIAIIGARTCTEYGEKMAKKFSRELSLKGLTIISGMAKGIDSFAHIESLQSTGNTIAVLPSGSNEIYPKENIKLYNKILEDNGLILSEYDENIKADSKKFLERNRIVTGLSIGILVIEGGCRSGTSVTAKLAKEQQKNIFCIPSSLENLKGITPNKLIKEGAFLVTELEDIISKYPELKLKNITLKKQRQVKEEIQNKFINTEYKEIYEILNYDKTIHINEIVKKLNININEAIYKLMMLELEGKIALLPGNNYKKI